MAGRDSTESLERLDVTLQECFLSARWVNAVDRCPGVGQAVHEQVALGLHPVQDHPHIAEVDLGLNPWQVLLRDHRDRRDLAVLDRDLRTATTHVVPDRRVRHLRLEFVEKTGVDPPGGVALLARRVQVSDKHRVDRGGVRAEFRRGPIRGLSRRRVRGCQGLPHRPPVHPVKAREFPDRVLLDPGIPTDRREQLHPRTRPGHHHLRVNIHSIHADRGGATSDRHTTRHAGQVGPPQTVMVGPTQAVRAKCRV